MQLLLILKYNEQANSEQRYKWYETFHKWYEPFQIA